MIINLKSITFYKKFIVVLDNTPLLTQEVSIDHGISEIRFLSLQLAHGVETRLERKHFKI